MSHDGGYTWNPHKILVSTFKNHCTNQVSLEGGSWKILAVCYYEDDEKPRGSTILKWHKYALARSFSMIRGELFGSPADDLGVLMASKLVYSIGSSPLLGCRVCKDVVPGELELRQIIVKRNHLKYVQCLTSWNRHFRELHSEELAIAGWLQDEFHAPT